MNPLLLYISVVSIVISLLIVVKILLSKKRINDLEKSSYVNYEQIMLIQREIERRKNIKETVDKFLENCQREEPLFIKNEQTIFKILKLDDKIYQFKQIMKPSEKRFGIDDERLCFDDFEYHRLNTINDSLNHTS